jgi:hypothetical protein
MNFKIKHKILQYESKQDLELIPDYNKYTLYGQPSIVANNAEDAILAYLRMGVCDNKPKPYIHNDTWIFYVLICEEDRILKIVKNLSLNLE